MEEDTPIDAAAASKDAVHKQKNAAQAVEVAREAQMLELAQKTAEQTEAALLRSLQSIFGMNGGDRSKQEMNVLVQRVPILCINIAAMFKEIAEIKDNQKWAVRAVIGASITIVVTVIAAVILAFVKGHF